MKNDVICNYFFLFLFIIMGVCVSPRVVSAYEHPGGLHTRSQLEFTRKKISAGEQPWSSAWSKVLEFAKERRNEKPSAVADYNIPSVYAGGDARARNEAAKKIMIGDAEAAYSAAIVYALGVNLSKGERARYADKVIEILDDWARVHKKSSGGGGNLNTAYMGIVFIWSAELLWDYKGWSSADRKRFKNYSKDVLYKKVTVIKHESNNWGDWGVLMALGIDHLNDDTKNMKADTERLKELINRQIKKDGSMPKEISRGGNNSLFYTSFALEPMTAAIEVVRNSGGPNLFKWEPPTGGTVKDALNFLFDKGVKNTSQWPVKGVDTPGNKSYTSDVFEAMGIVYRENKWSDWAKPPVPRFGTGLGFVVPTLLQPSPLGEKQPQVTLTSPTNLRLSITR